jgi:drug/metabolite transporter (DMT)-like permease
MKMPAHSNQNLGYLLAAIAAISFGMAVAISRYAYDSGANGITVASFRALVMAAGLWGFCLLSGRNMHLPRALYPHVLGLGLLLALMYYGNIGSVEFIPIGLAALVFFTFPPVIAVIEAVLDRRLPPLMKIFAVGLGFVGIAMMLGVSLGDAHPVGIALALMASAATAVNAVWMGRRMVGFDMVKVTAYLALVAAVALPIACVLQGGPQFPTDQVGWAGVIGVAVLQSTGIPIYYASIPLIGALKSAMVTNIQPVVSIIAAYFLFGELLDGWQIFGGGLVLLGVWLMNFGRPRYAPEH